MLTSFSFIVIPPLPLSLACRPVHTSPTLGDATSLLLWRNSALSDLRSLTDAPAVSLLGTQARNNVNYPEAPGNLTYTFYDRFSPSLHRRDTALQSVHAQFEPHVTLDQAI